jgi:hypothetical protein
LMNISCCGRIAAFFTLTKIMGAKKAQQFS